MEENLIWLDSLRWNTLTNKDCALCKYICQFFCSTVSMYIPAKMCYLSYFSKANPRVRKHSKLDSKAQGPTYRIAQFIDRGKY